MAGRSVLEARAVHIDDVGDRPRITRCRSDQIGSHPHPVGVPLLRDEADWRLCLRPLESSRSPKADRAGLNLRRPGGDRDRECAAVQRVAGAHATICRSRWNIRPRRSECSKSSANRLSTATGAETVLETAMRLCGNPDGLIFRLRGRRLPGRGLGGLIARNKFVEANQISPGRDTVVGRTAFSGQPVQITDARPIPNTT